MAELSERAVSGRHEDQTQRGETILHIFEIWFYRTLDSIDDSGQFHLRWDNGESSVLVIGEDSFSVLPPEPTTLKLLMPLTAELYVRDDYGEYPDEAVWLNGWDLLEYEDKIRNALVQNRMPEEKDRGIMRWYSEEDSVNRKVCSAVFSIEERDGRLWGTVDCNLIGRLTPEELMTFKEYVSGQASDGWGEGFEDKKFATALSAVMIWNLRWNARICGMRKIGAFKLRRSSSVRNMQKVSLKWEG